jgi:hypothetical protein
MQRIERKSLIKPIRKDDFQASALNQRFDSKFQALRNAVACEADRMNGCNIAEQQPRVRAYLGFLTALPKSQLVGVSGFRVPKINQAMIAFIEVEGMSWTAGLLQIGLGSNRNDSCVEEFSAYKC